MVPSKLFGTKKLHHFNVRQSFLVCLLAVVLLVVGERQLDAVAEGVCGQGGVGIQDEGAAAFGGEVGVALAVGGDEAGLAMDKDGDLPLVYVVGV